MTDEKNSRSHTTLRVNLQYSVIIALCFLWTSTGYLSWMYHLLDFTEAASADWLTEVIGYIFQAIGLLCFSLVLKHKKDLFTKKSVFIICIGIDFIFIILSTLAGHLICILIFGYLMNFLHGIIAGFYLTLLATQIKPEYRSVVFGGAYGVSSIASWILSLVDQANFIRSDYALIAYGIFICITIGIIITEKDIRPSETIPFTRQSISTGTIALSGLTVLLLSLTRGIGFYFPMADLSTGINLEFSRAFYAIGLILAGIIGDQSRKCGAISCLIALVFPFAMIALSNEISASTILWILGYIFFGFLTVFRVTLFSDIACMKEESLYVAGFGLMFGRIGDAVGNLTGIMLNNQKIMLVLISSICFAVTFVIFFVLYNRIYIPVPQPAPSPEERLTAFIQKYEISSHESDVLKLIAAGASNGEISAQLFISENTVKFHVRNILKKAGCANRAELLTALNHMQVTC